MYRHRDRRVQFDVVDIDPYGSANIFMDTAVQAVQDGGLICITCTDLAVLAGSKPLACFAKYGIMPHRAKYCHEMVQPLASLSLWTASLTVCLSCRRCVSCSLTHNMPLDATAATLCRCSPAVSTSMFASSFGSIATRRRLGTVPCKCRVHCGHYNRSTFDVLEQASLQRFTMCGL